MSGRRAALGAAVVAVAALPACRSAEPVFVCPVGAPGWGDGPLAVEGLEAADGPGGLRVTGRVTDGEMGDPVPGAAIAVVGTRRGAMTGADGRFALDSLRSEQTLRVAFVGYAPLEASVAEIAARVR